MQYHIPTIDAIPSVAQQFIEDHKDSHVFVFHAQMGMGKTTFILGLLRAMGVHSPEGSPTYSLVNTYKSPMFGTIFHFDLYRLQELDEAYDIGIEEMIYDETAYSFIEWPDIISELLPENTVHVTIQLNNDGERFIETCKTY